MGVGKVWEGMVYLKVLGRSEWVWFVGSLTSQAQAPGPGPRPILRCRWVQMAF
jgi:hypothetical protein